MHRVWHRWQAGLASGERQRHGCCEAEEWHHCSQEIHYFQERRSPMEYANFPYLYDAGRPAYDATPEQLTDPRMPALLARVMPRTTALGALPHRAPSFRPSLHIPLSRCTLC